jgi:hypothetical protein
MDVVFQSVQCCSCCLWGRLVIVYRRECVQQGSIGSCYHGARRCFYLRRPPAECARMFLPLLPWLPLQRRSSKNKTRRKSVALPHSHPYGHPAPLVPSGSSPRDASLISTPRSPVHHLPRLLTPTHRLGKGVRHGCVARRFMLRSAAWHVQEKHVSVRGPSGRHGAWWGRG